MSVNDALGKYRHVPMGLYDRIASLMITKRGALSFEMNASYRSSNATNRPNIIPWLIDFYIRDPKDLEVFYKRFCHHPLILVSSKEVYDFLIGQHCPLPIAHCALSLADKYRIDENSHFDKTFDVLLLGRQNPVLLTFLRQYEREHQLSVVTCKVENGHYNYYDQSGKFVGNADSRDGCISLLRQSRIGLYSTQGLDGDKRSGYSNGFSQVTPRFLEYLATGNHVIARYVDNADTRFYGLDTICPHTDSYESFVLQMDRALHSEPDMGMYSSYLNGHYTSNRIELIKSLIQSI